MPLLRVVRAAAAASPPRKVESRSFLEQQPPQKRTCVQLFSEHAAVLGFASLLRAQDAAAGLLLLICYAAACEYQSHEPQDLDRCYCWLELHRHGRCD